MLFNVGPFMENLQTRADGLIATGRMRPMIIAAVDCFTKFGGSQYLNSSAVGQSEYYITKDVSLPKLCEALKEWLSGSLFFRLKFPC